MTSTDAISIIIPTLNEEHYLPGLLRSLAACVARPLEIIVVDGRSADHTLAVVETCRRSAPASIRIRAIESNARGVAHQRNAGAAEAHHDLLLFLDADTAIPSPRHFEELLRRFRQSRCVAASCRFVPLEADRRAALYFWLLYGFQRLFERISPYAVGACILTTRDVFRRTGGFDPSLRVNEDACFCKAASRMGTFRVLPTTIAMSARRFRRDGYLRTGLRYVWIFLDRTFRGEVRDDRVRYDFRTYD